MAIASDACRPWATVVLVVFLVACIAWVGAAVAQPQAREVGFVEVEDGVRAYAERLPNVGSMEVQGAGHHLWNDAYDIVMPRLRNFLSGAWPDDVVR